MVGAFWDGGLLGINPIYTLSNGFLLGMSGISLSNGSLVGLVSWEST